jgi:hypothetical protein
MILDDERKGREKTLRGVYFKARLQHHPGGNEDNNLTHDTRSRDFSNTKRTTTLSI